MKYNKAFQISPNNLLQYQISNDLYCTAIDSETQKVNIYTNVGSTSYINQYFA